MEIIILAAFITAFFAGMAALFAPCCIGVLLPAYFGSIFRQKKTILLMTLIFFLGLLTVFLPLGLGIGLFGEIFKEYHNVIYIFASILFLTLGISLLFGFHFSLHFKSKKQIKVTGSGSVFLLGLFSGFATLCCAPVLAGAMALSVLPGSVLLGGLYSVIFVLGMVSPLFVISYFMDKTNVMDRVDLFRKEFSYSILGRKINITFANLLSGLVFILMGFLIVYYALTNQLGMESSDGQLWINIMVSQITDVVINVLSNPLVQIVNLGLVALLIILGIFKISKNINKKNKK